MALYFSPFGAVFLFSLLNILFYKMYALQKWPTAIAVFFLFFIKSKTKTKTTQHQIALQKFIFAWGHFGTKSIFAPRKRKPRKNAVLSFSL